MKQVLTRAAAIAEGVRDFHEEVLESPPQYKPFVTDEDVKRIAALACNSLPLNEMDNPSCIWLAPNSLGIREIDSESTVELIQYPEDIYSYDGYDVKTARRVVVGSATSGATIEMLRTGSDEWTATFADPTEGGSVMYKRLFAHLGHDSLHDLLKSEIIEGSPFYDHPDDLPLVS